MNAVHDKPSASFARKSIVSASGSRRKRVLRSLSVKFMVIPPYLNKATKIWTAATITALPAIAQPSTARRVLPLLLS